MIVQDRRGSRAAASLRVVILVLVIAALGACGTGGSGGDVLGSSLGPGFASPFAQGSGKPDARLPPPTCPSFDPTLMPPPEPADPPQPVAGTIPGTFEVTNTGSASYVMKLAAPPGRAGIEPHLALAYDSDNTQLGPLGRGSR